MGQPETFSIRRESGDAARVKVSVKGEIDLASTGELHSEVDKVLEENPASVEIDMSEVTFIDASGLHAVAGLLRKCNVRGIEAKVVPSKPVVRLVGIINPSPEVPSQGEAHHASQVSALILKLA